MQNIINPIENLDEENLIQIEKKISDFYEYTKEAKAVNSNDLIRFNDIDLESYFSEKGDLDFDFNKLLNEEK